MKNLFLSLTMLVLAAPATAAAETATTVTADLSPQNRIVLLVDEYKAIRNFPLIVAERLGYLNDGKHLVTVMNIRDDIFHAPMLMDGRIDAVMAYYHHNIVSQSEGRFSEAIVTLGVTPGQKVLVANQVKDKYRTLADLKGSRFIAGGAGSSKSTVANLLMLRGGHQLGDYTRLGTDGKDRNVEALRSGAADFVVAPTPDGSFYESAGVATVFADLTTVEGTKKHFGTLFPTSTVFMKSDRVKSNPEIAQHLANAFVRTLKYINSHSAEEIAALIPVEISGKDRAAYLKILKEAIPMFANDGTMPADGAENEWRVLCEFNPKYRAVDLRMTYTNKFVDEALRTYR